MYQMKKKKKQLSSSSSFYFCRRNRCKDMVWSLFVQKVVKTWMQWSIFIVRRHLYYRWPQIHVDTYPWDRDGDWSHVRSRLFTCLQSKDSLGLIELSSLRHHTYEEPLPLYWLSSQVGYSGSVKWNAGFKHVLCFWIRKLNQYAWVHTKQNFFLEGGHLFARGISCRALCGLVFITGAHSQLWKVAMLEGFMVYGWFSRPSRHFTSLPRISQHPVLTWIWKSSCFGTEISQTYFLMSLPANVLVVVRGNKTSRREAGKTNTSENMQCQDFKCQLKVINRFDIWRFSDE